MINKYLARHGATCHNPQIPVLYEAKAGEQQVQTQPDNLGLRPHLKNKK